MKSKINLAMIGLATLLATGSWLFGQGRLIGSRSSQTTIRIKVPEKAEVWLDNHKTAQSGAERVFYINGLPGGASYPFEFQVRWTENGADKKVSRVVQIQRGESVVVDFTLTAPAGSAEAKPTHKGSEVKGPAKTRKFYFTYAGAVKELKAGTEASIWLPLPTSTSEQEASIFSKDLPGESTIHQEKQYGNRMLFFKAKANAQGEIPFKITYAVLRREVKTDQQGTLVVEPRPQENIERFLQPDKLVPISGKPLELLADVKLPADRFASAKVLYDVVNTHMKYSKEGKGWGRGDSVWACDSKFGNCTDFHSLFISMARGNKIAAKFEMGFPVPPKRGQGVIGGYHCWAWFMPDGKGWIPVDISEANRFPEMKEYYFGNLTEDRVQFSTGRDVDLEPRQKGPPLNFFIYPYVEVQGQTHPQERIVRAFAYEDVSSGK